MIRVQQISCMYFFPLLPLEWSVYIDEIFGWLQGKEMGCLFLPLYTFREKPFSHLYFAVCSTSNFSLWYNNNWCPYSYYQVQLKKKKKHSRRRGRRKECVMCGFCTEFQSNCEVYVPSSIISFPLFLNVFCTAYSCVVYFYVKRDYSFSLIYLSIYILLAKIFAFYSSVWTQIFYVEMWEMLASLLRIQRVSQTAL